ncbi:hypothetical protein [Paraburkholderia unamae]|uniref:Uncharacterized protein n=1 Tax=Paraburkholderia unamae TaxID=219649 RepID=A0ACC6RGP2_9BURK
MTRVYTFSAMGAEVDTFSAPDWVDPAAILDVKAALFQLNWKGSYVPESTYSLDRVYFMTDFVG